MSCLGNHLPVATSDKDPAGAEVPDRYRILRTPRHEVNHCCSAQHRDWFQSCKAGASRGRASLALSCTHERPLLSGRMTSIVNRGVRWAAAFSLRIGQRSSLTSRRRRQSGMHATCLSGPSSGQASQRPTSWMYQPAAERACCDTFRHQLLRERQCPAHLTGKAVPRASQVGNREAFP